MGASNGTYMGQHGGRALWWPQFDRESRIDHPAADMTAKLPSRPCGWGVESGLPKLWVWWTELTLREPGRKPIPRSER